MPYSKDEPIVPSDDKDFHYKIRGYENDREEQLQRSEKNAWRIAYAACLLALILGISISVVVKRFHPFAFLVEVDKATGETSVIKQMDTNTLQYQEAHDKHNIKMYVIARESYYYSLLQRDYDLTLNMSCDAVGSEYAKQYEGDKALDKVLGNGTEYRIKVLSIRLPNDQPGKAVVSFEKATWKNGVKTEGVTPRYIATLSYEYRPSLTMKESDWIDNPTGYKTCAYRADPELTTGR